MRLSLFMMPLHNPSKPFAVQLAEDKEAFLLADRLGFAEAWCGEHYSSATELITSPMMFFAHLAAQTSNLTFATGVSCLPHFHPAVMAGQVALFDHLTNGRCIFGIGPGGLASDFELFETDTKDRMAMVRESIDMILHFWREDPPYDLTGKFWNARIKEWHIPELGLGTMCKPLQKPHPRIAITASSPYSGSLKGAGARGWLPVSANFIGAWSLKTHWQVYEEAARKNNRVVSRDMWRVARSIYIADTDAEAEAYVKDPGSPFSYYYWYLYQLWERGGIKAAYVPRQDMSAADLDDFRTLRDHYVICGSAATVAEKLLALREEIGDFGHLLMAGHDWVDPGRMKATMHAMARDVMPAVNKAINAAPAAPMETTAARQPALA